MRTLTEMQFYVITDSQFMWDDVASYLYPPDFYCKTEEDAIEFYSQITEGIDAYPTTREDAEKWAEENWRPGQTIHELTAADLINRAVWWSDAQWSDMTKSRD